MEETTLNDEQRKAAVTAALSFVKQLRGLERYETCPKKKDELLLMACCVGNHAISVFK